MSFPLSLRLLVFDLDGTLIDSSDDLCNSVNATLNHFGRPDLPHSVIASYIGDGAPTLLHRAFHVTEHGPADTLDVGQRKPVLDRDSVERSDALTFFLQYYKLHKLDSTFVYPGVVKALTTIREQHPDLPMAVLTNKPVNPSRDICRHFGLDRFFFQNYGGDSFSFKKPDPRGLLQIMAEAAKLRSSAGLSAQEVVMVGDSDIDVLTARNCGARSIGCTFGLAPHTLAACQPWRLAYSPSDWPELIAFHDQLPV